jgi:hypothetical protein
VISAEVLFLIAGFVPFSILIKTRKYSYVALLAILGSVEAGIPLISGILLWLTDPGL